MTGGGPMSSIGQRSNRLPVRTTWRDSWKLCLLTISLAGMQLTWTVELGYGTPYLLSLGMKRSLISLVWLAGPLSGLIMQPLVGAFSDRCTSRFGRRRPFMIGGTLVVILGLLLIGWTKEIANTLSDDQVRASSLSVIIAVFAFYLVDFAVNTVQATIRALIVDVLPADKQEQGNAWAGGMIGAGSIGGYFLGMVNLVSTFPYFGNTQMKVLCMFAAIALFGTVAITCLTTGERSFDAPTASDTSLTTLFNPCRILLIIYQQFSAISRQLIRTMRQLPTSIQRICNTQFFAWIGWFPFLFYSTTWIAELANSSSESIALQDMQQQQQQQQQQDTVGESTRAGSFAFLLHSIVSLATACLLPMTVAIGPHPSKLTATSSGEYTHDLDLAIHSYPTIFASAVWYATVLIAICGISWAIMMWAPFALIGEIVNSSADHYTSKEEEALHVTHPVSAHLSSLTGGANGHQQQNVIEDDDFMGPMIDGRRLSDCAGEILGIHNIYVVIPQFVSTFVSSILFALFDHYTTTSEQHDVASTTSNDEASSTSSHSPAAIGWILRLGGISVLYAAYLSTKIRSA
ncbi:hypothetical protein BDF22DRAFT_741870 [Syncephalis plumigaleata]|nr:hypothetical protein BDF22DRAFT_741870 [Syncephalis plumigaleata]